MSNINNASDHISTHDQDSSSQASAEVDLELRLGPCTGSTNQGQSPNAIAKHRQEPNNSQENVGCPSSNQEKPVKREMNLTCSICLDALQQEACTTCGHIFCMPCIIAAVVNQGRCPTCRKAIYCRGIRRIYLPKMKS
ncbi:E3 ubiquitin-protein ligase complex slx8-rfp subunit slx8-like [Camellia sinensis]|uniref:E3 ubiquitin-protein ligase complex slx8-rfp subunit slx8-like n=1 Tax=Camellia sinensis TaxID=4442 RepID=UPI001036B3F0|nr:E3 ubiquitin-protein ligase complex slx8-rfp subunit slx8-like [Camellia sinensis]